MIGRVLQLKLQIEVYKVIEKIKDLDPAIDPEDPAHRGSFDLDESILL